ncbi:MAG: Cna B-type domain-containing protein [Clostridia bacterium]|nr:Cna B-type domain-containing protein [Clostridia bacterium]
MNNEALNQISEFAKKHQRKKRWHSVVTTLAAVVVFVTTYALILPAITMDSEPSCNLTEHIHTNECFSLVDGENVLLCELTEHTHHEIACYSDRSADVETKDDWESVLADVKLVGQWNRDVLLVARSQLGYRESSKNVICDENGVLQGYTRYGEWYGEPYGKWSCTFVSFCLEYAGVKGMPLSDDCVEWINILSEEKYGFYRKAGEHTPSAGEIVFVDKNGDGTADGVGIIDQVIPQIADKGAKLKVIEGGLSEQVQYTIYEYSSNSILGYSILPDGMYKQQTLSAQIFTDATYQNAFDGDGAVITVSGILPKAGKIYAYPVVLDGEDTVCAYDITVFDSEGNTFEPFEGDSLKVTILSDKLKNETFPEGTHPEVFYIPNEGEPERIATDSTENGVEFSAGHFSVYAVRAVSETTVSSFRNLQNAISNNKPYIKLTASISVTSRLDIQNKNITIDLNGYRLTAGASSTMFQLNSGGNLTIVDSKQQSETVTKVNSSTASYGNKATLSVSNNNAALTYYVTETEVVDKNTGATLETLYKHTVTAAGSVVGNGQPIVTVNGGTFTLESGMLRSGTNRAVYMTNGTANITGGYICGFTKSYSETWWQNPNEFGGAVLASGGTVNISGKAVLAANSAGNGGAIGTNGQQVTLNISGGIISGNTATYDDAECSGGGGISVNDSKVTMTGGYITNNVANGTKYLDGGGGIYLRGGNCQFTISGGYFTANKANGGGALKTKADDTVNFTMAGGFFSGNASTACEGAGVALERKAKGYLSAGYITNNKILQTVHWGGGGFFCADQAEVHMNYLLVTNNTAGGFGGGVAGCPTGKLTLYVDSGCAVFDNDDVISGEVNWVSGGTKDGEDFKRCDEVFQSHGHEDFFCANESTIFGTMLADGSAEWEGSADGVLVTASKGDVLTAYNVMGLQSHASDEDKRDAMAASKLFINGNHSDTHGGGIMCNGLLIVGEAANFTVPTQVKIQANKALYKGGTNEALPLDNYNFNFNLVKGYLNGEVLETVKCDSEGFLSFSNGLKFFEDGTYNYYIMEVPDEKTNTVLFDNSIYRVTFNVKRDNGTEFNGKTKYTYQITSMSVDKSTDDGNTWSNIHQSSNAQGESVTIALSKGYAFVNRTMEFTKLTVKKQWDGAVGADSVTVTLKQDGVEYNKVTLSAANGWEYTWNNLPTGHQYTVEEESVFGYTPSYNVVPGKMTTVQKQLGNGTYWVPATSIQSNKKYIIVSSDGKKALCVTSDHTDSAFTSEDTTDVSAQRSQITLNGTKYDFWMSNITLAKGATFTPQTRGKGGTALKSDIGDSWLLAQEAGGNVLKSTNSIDWSSLVVGQNGLLKVNYEFEGTANDLRTVVFENGKFNTVKDDAPLNAAMLLTQVSGNPTVTETTIQDAVIIITNAGSPGYQLPETGGNGTFMYIAAGTALIMLGAYLAYRKIKGGREDIASL